MTKFSLTAFFAFTFSLFLSGQSAIWNDIPDPKRETQQIHPESYRTMTVDFESLKSLLLAAPKEGTDLRNSNYTLQLPTADGSRAEFKIVEESVMAPELQARYPNIRSFMGIGTGDYANANISLDFTLKGFHAQVLIEGKSYYIDPLSPGDLNTYIVYSRESFFNSNTKKMASCEPENIRVPQPGGDVPGQNLGDPGDIIVPLTSNGTQLRTYDLALACTGEYAQYQGGTVPLVMSAMTTTMARVNGIYRSDLCLRMIMISNNDDLIFLNSITDGYTNNNGSAMLTENQSKIDFLIGSSNYDIGHVFSTGGGGIASLGVVCNNSSKAQGVTGSSSPDGDPFDIDYVAHEMGHQWDAEHTFNNSCSGNRVSSSAYEPGSGSTIMGYAGICGPNLQSNSDAYFHNRSYTQIVNYSVTGAGNSCATIEAALNSSPIITMPSGGFFIPKSTPFELTASATDPEGDALTYCWEQYDLGSTTASGDNNLTNPSGNAPIFRSWDPTSSPTRVFPRLSDLVNNTTVIGEHLPTYARDLTFRCTVRDSWINGAVNDAQVAFDVASNSGPFLVSSPNTATTWTTGSNQTVTWNVANTTASPVSCSTVNIYLSTDGGFTYPTLLLGNTANDGSASVLVPNILTTQARIKVKASSNIFFDISNTNFTIGTAAAPSNDAICSAITLNCGADLAGTSVNATPSALGTPSCAGGTDNDVFYKFNATAGNTYTITVNGDNYDGVLAIYSGFCYSTLTEIDCADNGFTSGVLETITYTPTISQIIYIQTYDWSSNEGEFNITLECEFANDDPCDASTLTCGETVSGSNTGATQSTLGSPSCASGSQNDVFYKIEAIEGVDYTVTVNGDNYDGVLAAYTGSCSGTLTELDCSDDGTTVGIVETINFSVTYNQTVYIQTYDWFSSGGEFLLTVSCANVPYDEPCDARNLSCGESFSGSSAGATQSSIGSPSCESFGSQKDVFFKFMALANVDYSVTVNGDTYDGVLAAYTGSCSGTLTEIDCSDNGISDGVAETVNISVPTDQEIIIQTYDYYTTGPSDFTITLNCPIPDNDDCADAITLTVNNAGSCPANQVVGTTYGASGSSVDACEDGSPDVFYTFNSGNSDEVIINLDYITASDLVLSVFEASCGSEAISCIINTSSNLIPVTPFTNYYVRVHSYIAAWSGTFNICIEKVAPAIATINGTVTGWNSNCATRNVTVSMFNTSTFLTYIATTTLSTSGTFVVNSVAVPAGTYDILVKVQGALAVISEDVVLSAGANSLSTGPVILGDINNNNVINVLDLSVFSASFGTTSASPGYNFLADLNCDGAINIFDVSILGAGFNQVGDNLPLP